MMGKQYIYPADLKAEPRLWLWSLKDLAALGIALFGVLTIRADDQSVLDFLKRAVRYFITEPQEFFWQEKSVGSHHRREEAQMK